MNCVPPITNTLVRSADVASTGFPVGCAPMLLVRVVSETDTGGVALAAESVVAGGFGGVLPKAKRNILEADITQRCAQFFFFKSQPAKFSCANSSFSFLLRGWQQ